MGKLQGKKAMITGANRSIGQAIAIQFAQEGADCVISYRSDEKGAAKTVEAIQRLGRRAKSIYADFSNMQAADQFFHEALDFLGTIDLFVNNAASYIKKPFLDLTAHEFESLFQVGVTTCMRFIQLAAKEMIHKKKSGSIINISSISGLRPYPESAANGTAKAALNMLTQSTALELAPFGIRVNAIAAGTTPYDVNEVCQFEIPLGRVGLPQDHSQAALFLASDESSWITGQVFTVDGGQSLSL